MAPVYSLLITTARRCETTITNTITFKSFTSPRDMHEETRHYHSTADSWDSAVMYWIEYNNMKHLREHEIL